MANDSSGASTFAEVFRASLAERGLSLSGLKRMLEDRGAPIALATLSYWRSASRQPDAEKQQHTIAEAEAVLQLEPGTLSALAARPRKARILADGYTGFNDLDDDLDAIFEEAMRVLDIDATSQLREVTQVLITDVGVDGYSSRNTVRTMLQCVSGTVHRVMWATPSPQGGADATVVTVIGGSDAGHWVDPSNRLHAVAVQLDPPLDTGDTVMLEVRTDYLEGLQTEMSAGIFEHSVAQKIVNWVRFHPDAVPDWFLEIENTPEGETRLLRGLDAPTSIHQARWDFGPGGLSLEWGYGAVPDPRQPDGA